jgi:hypothetical protein
MPNIDLLPFAGNLIATEPASRIPAANTNFHDRYLATHHSEGFFGMMTRIYPSLSVMLWAEGQAMFTHEDHLVREG